ncbi:hypothetical protein F5B22DRAFT_654793 [Xylaria bambusicola]|uniref:uncharacterized protein n=1 Tax=Xylaria bambusicola TaxID=326684 RepID=UPI0020081D15|nr:uncharacterized protein F5B22DRAFT_654793 [Xylaria bambusicola]KAI0517577.1 hypothetical protein F5B22DRAFT_654793 [Xylaria bambusicola]
MNSKQTPLLFVHNAGPTHVHDRDHKTKTKIRQHVMLDIGRKRRKRLRNPQLEMVFQFSGNDNATPVAQSESSRHNDDSIDRRHMPALVYPFWHQHPLDVLESHWGRDMFSAYGIMLMLNEGRNPVSTDRSTERFIFPFAFQKSPFLRHYAQLIIRPGQLAGVPHEKPTRLKMMALERSMDAISCVETALAGTNLENPSTELVILAIIAVISFNLISSDRDQALLHIWGLESLIAALGDSFTLRDHDEIRLMIFWVDVTTSLLHDSIPRFPLPSDLVPVVPPVELPLPLRTLMILRSKADKNISHVLSCMMDLNAIASLIESELTVRGDVLWGESVLLGLWLNPVAHRLLDRPPVTDISYRPSPISEALRQGALLWVIWIQRRYHAYPGSPTAIVQKLLSLLTQPDWSDVLTDTDLMSVHLWLLVLCGINCDVPAASPNLAGMIPLRMRQMGWDNWSEVMMYVRQMPWTHAIDVAATQLAERVERTNLLSIN